MFLLFVKMHKGKKRASASKKATPTKRGRPISNPPPTIETSEFVEPRLDQLLNVQTLKVIDETPTSSEIFKNDKKRGYSGVEYRNVLDFLGLDHKVMFAKKSEIERDPSLTELMKKVNQKTIDGIIDHLIRITKTNGPISSGNEVNRNGFIYLILYGVMSEYYEYKIDLEKEYWVVGSEVKGPVDFIIVNKKCVIICVEAKKDDWVQGRAQNLMQVYNAYLNNIKTGLDTDHTVYGIITTGYSWEFIWCKGPALSELEGNYKIEELRQELAWGSQETERMLRQKLVWKYKRRFDPIETDVDESEEVWKESLMPLIETLSIIISSFLITKGRHSL